MDLLLSSGFLAFARHVGFLEAVEAAELQVDAIVGTSSGAMVGALWSAGMSAREVGRLVSSWRMLDLFQLYPAPWRGVFSLGKLIRWLEGHLPSGFSDLRLPFAVGVGGPDGHTLLTAGALPDAVAASCAMPGLFGPVTADGVPYRDGGMHDRLAIEAWRTWRGSDRAVVHHVQRTAGVEVEADLSGLTIVSTPRSRASLLGLRDFDVQVEEARRITEETLCSHA